ncbi:GNAT family N-acetyltransferase [Agromyces binzhouensis]|uniref:GNAT family N-acetyltransferase n=1 Tax=Agromyces binzhouensis TaxID=1817495 RepID=A0A4V1QRV0_9MICO|nr:GNAT family N-acetyltransferase [Agromyces binzhouensis]RXZ46163.1 GNAT family N-acetyltransferase [Agromyces binzhouensis]
MNRSGTGGEPVIRRYRAADRAAVAEVCLRTAAAGGDATGLYSDDSLMPEVYALPYVEYQPDLAYVVEFDGRVAGYVLGIADTQDFIAWYARAWAPAFRERHPVAAPPSPHRPAYTEAQLVADGGDAERMRIPELDAYPAHLHIDLLPELQGRGLGRRLVDTLRAALAERGVPALHLGIDAANVGARAFYERLGFHELPSSRPDAPRFGIATG